MTITLSEDQEKALVAMNQFLLSEHSEFCLEGFAGTGKTTVIQHLLASQPGWRPALTAPTNKASRVLERMAKDAGVDADIMTTYSLLGLKLDKDGEAKRITRGVKNRLAEYNLVIVDEASMINQSLRGFLFEAVMTNSIKIIYMGDPLQLPPVKEATSPVFMDAQMQRFKLTHVVRQALDNPIIAATAYIRKCIAEREVPVFTTTRTQAGGLFMLEHAKWLHWLSSGFNSLTYENDPDAFRAVAWTNRQVGMINRRVRAIQNPEKHLTSRFLVGERVVAAAPVFYDDTDEPPLMTTDREATVETVEVGPHPLYGELFGPCYNLTLVTDDGELVNASAVHPDYQDKHNAEVDRRAIEARKDRRAWANFWEFKEMYADLRPCHALTVHRSQGSTYGTVFVHMGDIMSNRNKQEALQCLYVAVSRAADNVIITLGDQA